MLLNRKNNKAYIGQTKNFNTRMTDHRRANDQTMAVHRSIKKYGWNAFDAVKLCENIPLENLNALEKYYISLYNTFSKDGYNMNEGGQDASPSKESRARTSSTLKGKLVGSKNGMFGRQHTQESKDLMSKNRLGKNTGPDHYAYGKPRPKSLRKKQSIAMTGKMVGELNPNYGNRVNSKSLKEWRSENKLTHKDLAKILDCSTGSIHWWEKGKSITDKYLERFIERLDFDPTL